MSRFLVAASFLVFSVSACSGRPGEPIAVDQEAETWNAFDYCRTTTCAPPTGWPRGAECEPAGWADKCSQAGKWDVPLWWRTSCVGFSVQEDASRRVTLAEATRAAGAAFDAWPQAGCGGTGAGSTTASYPSIAARDLGPVACGRAWSGDGPNQNVVVFHDDTWPYDPHTLAQTWVTFDPRTGEIFDADIEVDEANYDIRVLDAPRSESFDLQVVLTHEAGHFYGLSHSTNEAAVMYASDEGSSFAKRALNASDVDGICAIYPPDGPRSVSALVDASGAIAAGACDPTPHGGFASCR